MDIAVCVKRVPQVGGRIAVTAGGLDVDTGMSGFAVSPHEECAVEAALQLTEREGGTVTVITLGPPEAAEQLRDMLALGAGKALHLETDGREWGPIATAAAIADAVIQRGSGGKSPFDLLLFGNESADTGGYQVGIRVAHALGLPCVTGIKALAADGAGLRASREHRGITESFDLPLPAVVGVREGLNLPRYPSLPGRLRARRASIDVLSPQWQPDALRKERLRVPPGAGKQAEVLGTGTGAVPALAALLDNLGVLP